MGKVKINNCLSLVVSLLLIFTMFFNVYGCGNANYPEFYSMSGAFQKGSDTHNKLPYVYSDYLTYAQNQYKNSQINKDKIISEFIGEVPTEIIGKATPIKKPRHIKFYELS